MQEVEKRIIRTCHYTHTTIYTVGKIPDSAMIIDMDLLIQIK
jgi:hypothetical protein